MKLSIGRAWDESRAILARDGALIIVIAAAWVLLPEALSNVISPPVETTADKIVESNPIGSLVALVATLAALVGGLAISSLALRPGQTVGNAIGHAAKAFLPLLGTAILAFLPMFLILVFMLAGSVGGSTPEEMIANFENMSSGVALGLIVWLVAVLVLSLRLMLSAPIALTESHNPVEIIKRGWSLTRGHFLRLFGYTLMLGIVALCVMAAAGVISGILAKLVFGDPEPFTVSALVIGLFSGLAAAFVTCISALMSARIYAQLTTTLSVPNVEA